MRIKTIEFKVFEYLNIDELSDQDKNLLQCAREAGKDAYAPYSHFRVGSAVLLENGEIIRGNNQENAAYPSGLCAERVALFYASANYPSVAIKALAVSALNIEGIRTEIAKPCGACRQVISEFEDLSGTPVRIILDGQNTINVFEGIDNLLPMRFRKDDLNKTR
jgi:cytidine deaminase